MDFNVYSTPSPNALFSRHFFQHTSIERVVNYNGYPVIAPEHAVHAYQWSNDVPRSIIATTFVTNEIIPNVYDLAEVFTRLRDAFLAGFRSVVVEYYYQGIEHKYCYHFAKLNLIKLVNNYDKPRRDFGSLLLYLDSPRISKLGLDSVINEFRQCNFLDGLAGFAITRCPLYKLASLIDEEWVEQDILDALVELDYFQTYAKGLPTPQQPDIPAPPNIVIPTDFLQDAALVLHAKGIAGLESFPAAALLRCRIASTPIASISICRFHDGHFTALTFEVGSNVIKYGDSMHGSTPLGLGPLISQALSTPLLRIPFTIEPGHIARQGGIHGGSGSCGLAALNFIQRLHDPKKSLWNGPSSSEFRTVALLDLIRYHCIARARVKNGESFHTHWARPASAQVAQAIALRDTAASSANYSDSCYEDFNLYTPTSIHPIVPFLERGPALVIQDTAPGTAFPAIHPPQLRRNDKMVPPRRRSSTANAWVKAPSLCISPMLPYHIPRIVVLDAELLTTAFETPRGGGDELGAVHIGSRLMFQTPNVLPSLDADDASSRCLSHW